MRKESMGKYAEAPVATDRMPPGVPYIIGNEAAERFSFYGMRTILTVFMVNYLWLMGDSPVEKLTETEAKKYFHYFVSAAYLTPILGAFLADFFYGKFRVIVWLSIVYCLGHGALALMGYVGNAHWWLVAGLWLISLGAGGIKPCVSAHVGDQFGKSNRHLLTQVFNWFYWSINLGAFVSTLLTPWLLEWYGPHWAFGVPGVLMAIATIVFWMGRWKFVHIPAKGRRFISEIVSPEGKAAILKLLGIYCFVAIFWALYDQTGSSWVLQAEDMDRNWLGIEWLPSQIQALNPILILIFIPLFAYGLYPAIDRIFPLTPLRKIGIGLFLTASAFALIAHAQTQIDAGHTPSISWQLLAYVLITAGEVMVSIVCLEFSYTQAPRSMKSAIMALFLFSVSLGNLFTSAINQFIEVDHPIKGLAAVGEKVIHPGADEVEGTDDDLTLTFDRDGTRTDLSFAGKNELDPLLDQIAAEIEASGLTALPAERGTALASAISDPWGQPYQYRLLNRNQMRIWSLGPDRKALTPWDQGAVLTINRPAAEKASTFERLFEPIRPDQPWLEKRKALLGASQADVSEEAASVTRDYFVGGLVKLEGATYFWFFTIIMTGAALLFIVVALYYRPREYFYEEETNDPEMT